MASSCVILGAGNPLLDISANVPVEMLAKYGVKNGDIILAEEKHMAVYNELVSEYGPVDYIAGGATQNSIRVAAWMAQGCVPCGYVGCVGNDANAATLKERCEAAGVEANYMVDEATPTGKCACLITPDGERCLITDLQAANNYKKTHLETAESQAMIESAKIIYSAGFFLTSGGPECAKFLGEACGEGKKFCLNLSAPFICEFFTAAIDETMPFVDVLFGNETEAQALGKVKGWGDDVATIAAKIAELPQAPGKDPRMVVITQGCDPTVVVYKGETTQFPVEKLARELLVDTNGAGDAFVGGFLSQLAQQRNLAACCDAGNFAARHIIQRSGCTMDPICGYKYKYVPPKVWEHVSSGGKFASINSPTAGARTETKLPVGEHPIQLYSMGTPNGIKVTVMLEELNEVLGVEYDAWMISILSGDQFGSDFVGINPNSKIPAMIDRSDPAKPIRLFESGSMLLYLAEKYGKFLPTDPAGRAECMNWVFWQMGSAPYLGGGFGHFYAYAPEKFEYPINRFAMEAKRQLSVLDLHLGGSDRGGKPRKFIMDDEYTIADMIIWPWYGAVAQGTLYGAAEFLDTKSYTHIMRWAEEIAARPAVKRGRIVNRTWGPEAEQLKERHSKADFAGKNC